MANFDIAFDTAPAQTLCKPRGPKIANMRTALAGVNGGLSYTADRLNAMSENDMISACRVEGLTVNGI